jgi:hypothetical protein
MSTTFTVVGRLIRTWGKTQSTRSVQRLIQVLGADLSEATRFWLAARKRKLHFAEYHRKRSILLTGHLMTRKP